MEEAGGPPAQAEAPVVSATLTWRRRPPAQEEMRHRFHKVSLVTRAQIEAPQEEMFEYSHRREEVNGFAAREETTTDCQGPRDGAGSKSFQSHGPIFSKKYIRAPKEKRPAGRLKEALGQGDGSPQEPRTEPASLGTVARTEILVPLPGPREPSPHPGVSLISGSPQSLDEQRVTRTVQTTVVVGGHVERRVNSSVTVGPVLSGEALPRGRNVARTVRAVVVGPQAEGSPSRSQARELLSSLMPAERSPPTSWLPRPRAAVPRSPGLGSTVGTALGQLPDVGMAESKDRSALAPAATTEDVRPPENQDVPAAHPDGDESRAPDPRNQEVPRVQGASRPAQRPLPTLQDHAPLPSSPRHQTPAPSLGPVPPPVPPAVPAHPRAQLSGKPRGPQALPSVKREGLTDPSAVTIPLMVKSEVIVTVPGQPVAPSSTRKKAVPSSGELPGPSSPRNTFVQDSGNVPIFSLTQEETAQGPDVLADPSPTQKEVVQGHSAPVASSPKPTKVVQAPEAIPSSQKEAVQSTEGGLAPSLVKDEAVRGPTASTLLCPPKDEDVEGSEVSPISSPTRKEALQGSGASAAPFSTQKVVAQDAAVLPVPSSVDKVSPGPEGLPAPALMGTEADLEFQLVPDSTEGRVLPETSKEEEVALAADLEIFLDTLRSMEPPEILRTHRLPRAPRSSYLAMYATLPAIEEDQPGPWVLGPSPQDVPTREEKEEQQEEEEEEPENPYLSDDEKLQRRQEGPGPGSSWASRPARSLQVSSSPLEMMKKHVAGAKGPHPELGPERQAGSRPTSRLGGSLLFGGRVPGIRETPTLEPLGTKLSALPPHAAPGLRKVPGQLPLLCSERPRPEKPASARPPEGWVSEALGEQGRAPGLTWGRVWME